MGGASAAAGAFHWAPPPPVPGAWLLPGLCWDGFKVEKVEEGRVTRVREGTGPQTLQARGGMVSRGLAGRRARFWNGGGQLGVYRSIDVGGGSEGQT